MPDTITQADLDAVLRVSRAFGHRGFEKLLTRFLADVDRATPGLPTDERNARAMELYRAHMADLGRRSGTARRAK
jgi:hypothetical protein